MQNIGTTNQRNSLDDNSDYKYPGVVYCNFKINSLRRDQDNLMYTELLIPELTILLQHLLPMI
jgi:hypothetical protein